jgi:hypothetical protein
MIDHLISPFAAMKDFATECRVMKLILSGQPTTVILKSISRIYKSFPLPWIKVLVSRFPVYFEEHILVEMSRTLTPTQALVKLFGVISPPPRGLGFPSLSNTITKHKDLLHSVIDHWAADC